MKTLLLITDQYPFGTSESFLESEVPYLSKLFETIFVVPSARCVGRMRPMPANFKIFRLDILERRKNRVASLLSYVKLLYYVLMDWKNFDTFTKLKQYVQPLFWTLATAGRSERYFQLLFRHLIGLDKPFLVYHYWKNTSIIWSHLCMSGLMRKSRPIICRAHGYDVYPFRRSLPFRYSLKNVPDKIYTVSKHGAEFLADQMGHRRKQLSISRLGVSIPGTSSPIPNLSPLKILTLSFLVPVKRLDLLLEALMLADRPIVWTVIGGGPLFEELQVKAKTLPHLVTVDFKGHLSPGEIQKCFSEESFHMLVNVSLSEGVPVSMMESLSWGIPIVATAVGGVPEIVNTKTGWLISPNPLPIEIYAAIIRAHQAVSTSDRHSDIREHCAKEARQKWNRNTNFSKFAHEIYALSN